MSIALKPRASRVLIKAPTRNGFCKRVNVEGLSVGDDGAHITAHCVGNNSIAHTDEIACCSFCFAVIDNGCVNAADLGLEVVAKKTDGVQNPFLLAAVDRMHIYWM
jgi:hypothetical protein